MNLLRKLLAVLGGTLVGIALIEILVFPIYLAVIPTNAMVLTQEFANQLAQSSKSGVIPRDYILVTGDSYAEGQGDELTSTPPGSRQAYASAHFIARRLERDVITVGRGGWGNTNSALAPGLFAARARASLLYRVPPPAAIVFYFYEGNDLLDNLRWARLQHRADLALRSYAPAEIAGFVAADRDREATFVKALARFGQANFPATLFLPKIFRVLPKWSDRPAARNPGPPMGEPVNRAMIGGKVVDLRERLQGPALGLSDAEWSNSILVLKASLQEMKSANPGIPVTVAYIPSPLSSYELASDSVSYPARHGAEPATGPRAATTATSQVAGRQHRLRRTVCEVARDLALAFVDSTPAIRSAARRQLVHGTNDWQHFNIEGYRVLGTAIGDFLASSSRNRPPEHCEPAPL